MARPGESKTFDDEACDSAEFVDVHGSGSAPAPSGVRRYGDGTKQARLEPKDALEPGTWYTVKVARGANDGAEGLAAPKTWHSKTRGWGQELRAYPTAAGDRRATVSP